MVDKIVAFETSGRDFSGPALMVADNADVAGDFERLPDYYVGHDRYNARADRLLAASRGVLKQAEIDVPGLARRVADHDAKLEKQLVDVRRDLADHYGARVRPS
jgi:hypothetical protein